MERKEALDPCLSPILPKSVMYKNTGGWKTFQIPVETLAWEALFYITMSEIHSKLEQHTIYVEASDSCCSLSKRQVPFTSRLCYRLDIEWGTLSQCDWVESGSAKTLLLVLLLSCFIQVSHKCIFKQIFFSFVIKKLICWHVTKANLAIKVGISKATYITEVGCFRPPSASKDAFQSISDILHEIKDSEFILLGDLYWDWLSGTSDCLKEPCDVLNLVQIINEPTRLNPKAQNKSTALDFIRTNAAHKYASAGVFACVRKTKAPKVKPVSFLKVINMYQSRSSGSVAGTILGSPSFRANLFKK